MEAFVLILFNEESATPALINQMVISDGDYIMYYDRESQYIFSTLEDVNLEKVDEETALTVLALATYGLLRTQGDEDPPLIVYSNKEGDQGLAVISFLMHCIPDEYLPTLPSPLAIAYAELSKTQPLAPHTPEQIKELIEMAKADQYGN